MIKVTKTVMHYGEALFDICPYLDKSDFAPLESKELREALRNPAVSKAHKDAVIDQLFKNGFENIIREICEHDDMDVFDSLEEAYSAVRNRRNSVVEGTLEYADPLSERDIEETKRTLLRKYKAKSVKLNLVENKSLLKGYRLTVNGKVFDNSALNALEKMRQKLKRSEAKSPDVVSVLRNEINDFDAEMAVEDVGTISSMGDGIVIVYGLSNAMYGEMVIFETGVKGMVQGLEEFTVSCVLLGSDHGLHEGSKVKRSGRPAGVPVGNGLIGRVVNAIGEPIDGGGEIVRDDFYPIESPAPRVIDRQPVTVPMETGILTIDSMFPIGRGQRELIIGDRQTGKTAIAVDTIVNQKGKNVICVYVAIGQKASTVAKLVNDFEKTGAMDYTIVVSASASDPASLQYIAPYAGTAMAEYFMRRGRDVLIVYDDLSKHAVAYRAMSLLLERPPGREAYPGDVFYLHSRLLERSSRLDEAHGGGSITALPIIETQAGDVSAYIPTNVISITDGQIFLESSLFFAGMRPAVNVGLSVSRVGGAAQSKAMKKAAGHLRIDLAQYREMEVFTQFSSDLDPATKELLANGDRIMELLKQPLLNPLSMTAQVLLLAASKKKVLLDIPVEKIRQFREEFPDFAALRDAELVASIEESGEITDEAEDRIAELGKMFIEEKFGAPEDAEQE